MFILILILILVIERREEIMSPWRKGVRKRIKEVCNVIGRQAAIMIMVIILEQLINEENWREKKYMTQKENSGICEFKCLFLGLHNHLDVGRSELRFGGERRFINQLVIVATQIINRHHGHTRMFLEWSKPLRACP